MIALHASGITITHLQEHKATVTTASGNHYTVIDRVFTVNDRWWWYPKHVEQSSDKKKRESFFPYKE